MSNHASSFSVAGTDVTSGTGSTAALSPIPIEQFDEYAMVARLGQGGMAEVSLGLAQGPSDFRKLVAIKRLHAHLHEDPDLVEMFQREARLAARLQHPHVVQTYKVGFADGRHFMAMEYLEGQSLYRILRRLHDREERIDPILAAELISQALDGLHHAHEATDFDGSPLGIVHRDISPHNLFVTLDGQLKVLDFGIAKAAGSQAFTRPGLIRGKLQYIAPECARSNPVDRRADLWSMAVTMWELLTGIRLFKANSDVDVLRALLIDELPTLSDFDVHVPSELMAIVGGALQREPEARFATALEMKEKIDAWTATQIAEKRRRNISVTALMQSLFADAVRDRRATLRACIAQLDADKQRDSNAAEASGLRRTEPELSQQTRPSLQAHLKLAAIACSVVVAMVVAFMVGRDDASTAHARVATPKVQTPERTPELAAQPASSVDREATPPLSLQIGASKSAPGQSANVQHGVSKSSESRRESKVRSARGAAGGQVVADGPMRAKGSPDAAAHAGSTPEAAQDTPSPAERVVASGRLRLDSAPYAVVTLHGRRLGITPIDVELPAATHTLTLRNPERGITTSYQVEVPAGDSVVRRIALE